MNITDTFLHEYEAAVLAGGEVVPPGLAGACTELVGQLKSDGFQAEQVLMYFKEHMARARAAGVHPERLDQSLITQCIQCYYSPPERPPLRHTETPEPRQEPRK